MDITPIIPQGKKMITGYGAGGFKINGEWTDGSLLVFGDTALHWPVLEAAAITLDLLEPVLNTELPIELLLIGTGKNTKAVSALLREELKSRHIAIDFMDTGAACRTYNVLLSEERRIAAALIAI